MTNFAAPACLGHHYAMQTREPKKKPREGTDLLGPCRINELGNYAKARITTRCVDKGDNSRILTRCDIGATEARGESKGRRPKPMSKKSAGRGSSKCGAIVASLPLSQTNRAIIQQPFGFELTVPARWDSHQASATDPSSPELQPIRRWHECNAS